MIVPSYNININGQPFKGKYTTTEGIERYVYFFDARAGSYLPLHAYIMYRDENNIIQIETGSNEINDLFRLSTSMEHVPQEELETKYLQMLLEYAIQSNIEIKTDVPGKPIYIEDQIIQGITKNKRQIKTQ